MLMYKIRGERGEGVMGPPPLPVPFGRKKKNVDLKDRVTRTGLIIVICMLTNIFFCRCVFLNKFSFTSVYVYGTLTFLSWGPLILLIWDLTQ